MPQALEHPENQHQESRRNQVVEIRQLSKSYGSNQALKPLDLSISSGEIFCLLGANGAGKTTTINLLLNFTQPSSGSAYICGFDVVEETQIARAQVTYLPEQVALYPELSAEENLRFFLALSSGIRPSQSMVTESLLEAGLSAEHHGNPVGSYSKGMRQKVGIALAIARSSSVLLLDEPTSGLDPVSANEFGELLLRLSKRGSAILMVTHDIFRAKQVGHRIGIMKRGVLVEHLKASEIETGALEALYLAHMKD